MTDFDNLVNKSTFFKKAKTQSNNEIKLNIACGPNIFPYDNWINYDRANLKEYFDFMIMAAQVMKNNVDPNHPDVLRWKKEMPNHQKRIVDFLIKGGSIDVRQHDVRNPFTQHADNSVDVIYLGQMIEHLNPIFEAPKLLKECFRMLKPNGTIRITTPDLDLLIKAYLNNDMDKFANEQPDFYKTLDQSGKLSLIMYGSSGPNCTWDNYEGHMMLYTQASMTALLSSCGFKSIKFFYENDKSSNKIILNEVYDAGMSHSFAVEAIK